MCIKNKARLTGGAHAEEMAGVLRDGPWESPGKYQAAKVGKGPAAATGPGARERYRKSIACILLHKSTLFRDEFYRNSKFYSMG